MNLPELSGATGISLGTVIGVVTKSIYDLITEGRRRRFERSMRFLDTGLTATVTFLAAAEWARKCREIELAAEREVDEAKKAGNLPRAAQWQDKLQQSSLEASASKRDAELSLTTMYLMSKNLGDKAHAYLKACTGSEVGREAREQLRHETEKMARALFKSPFDKAKAWRSQ